MFNVIESRKGIQGTRVLDLFAGTGNLGFEAISRGAAHVTSVDSSPESARLVRAGTKWFGIEHQMAFVGSDVETFLEKKQFGSFDIIFADPPYDWPGIPTLPDKILKTPWLSDDGWLIVEHDARHSFVNDPRCVFAKPYGRTIVSIFPNDLDEDWSK